MKKLFAVGVGGILSLSTTHGALYNGNGITGAGGAVGEGSLNLTDNGTTISATFNKGGSPSTQFADVLVLFVDSVANGFADTSQFSDTSSGLTKAVSGLLRPDARSTAVFVGGLTADYAIAVSVNNGAAVYHLVSGSTLEFVRNIPFSPTDTTINSAYSFSFDWNDIGLGSAATKSFDFESSYITATGSRSLESFESILGGSTAGFGGTVTFSSFDTYPLPAVPEPANAALAVFGSMALGAVIFNRVRKHIALSRLTEAQATN